MVAAAAETVTVPDAVRVPEKVLLPEKVWVPARIASSLEVLGSVNVRVVAVAMPDMLNIAFFVGSESSKTSNAASEKDTPPDPPEVVRETIKQQLGKYPEELFAEFEPVPHQV